MKKNLILMMAMMLSSLAFSQVGINTTNPASTLDVTAKNATGKASGVDGLLVPRVDRERAQNMANVPTSTLIYVNSIATGDQVGIAANINAVGYYYFDGTVWAKLNPNSGSNVNIYNSDGTLQGNRIVTQNDKTLAFTGTATNVFSVDGNTFSVDAANDRVGIGTIAPQNKLDLGTSHGGNSTTDVTGKKLAVYNAADGSDFYGLGINSGTLQFHAASTKTEAPGMILNSTGNVGIGTDAPSSSAILELNNTSKGFLTTRMTTAQRDAITPKPEGLMIYNLDVHCLQYWNATQWIGNCSNNNNGVATITDCSSGTLNGTYQQGVAMNSTNTKVLTVNVTQIGAWSLSSNTVNGVSWSGSGTFTTTGSQTITVTASGTPTASGSFSYIYNLGGNTCTGSITFVSSGGVATITDCTTGALNGTYQQGTAMNGTNEWLPITVNVTQLGAYSVTSNTVNGVTWSYSGTFTSLGSQTAYARASGTPTAAGTFSYTFNLGGSTCSRNITFAASGGVAAITNCSSIPAQGTYQAGTAMNSGNTKILIVNVTQLGPWTASSNTVNGISFSGSGNFTSTGNVAISLTASGTPTNSGTFSYIYTLGSSTCTNDITFASGGGVATITDCSSTAAEGTYQVGTAMNSSNRIIVKFNVTQTGPWSLTSNTVNGVTFSGSGTFDHTGAFDVYLYASGTPTAAGTSTYNFNYGGSTCSRNITFASSGGVATITDCTTGALNGTYKQGTAMNGTNEWFPITVNVTQLGAYSITSNTVNGVTWSYSGTFTSLGVQTAYARASGTPTAAGTFSYTFNLGSSTCQRSITFANSTPPDPVFTDCSNIGPNLLPGTFNINGQNVDVTVVTTSAVSNTNSTGCGVNVPSQSWSVSQSNSYTTFYFSKPVSNVQMKFGNAAGTFKYIAKNGTTTVTPILTAFNSSCIDQNNISGNTLILPSSEQAGRVSGSLNVGGTYFTELTVQGVGGTPPFGHAQFQHFVLLLCNATAQ